MSTKVTINLVDLSAKRSSSVSDCSDTLLWFGPEQVRVSYGKPQKFATLEQNFTLLDGSFQPYPDNPQIDDGTQYGWWTSSLSDADGNFSVNPAITLQFSGRHTCSGITLMFQEDYPLGVTIQWYYGTTLILSKDFQPDSTWYFCDQAVVGFNKIIVSFSKARPYHRVKLTTIEYGGIRQWTGKAVISAAVTEEVDPVSSELSINKTEFELYDADGEFDILNLKGMFSYMQQRQQITMSNDDSGTEKQLGVFYLDTWESSDIDVGKFTAYDSIGQIDKITFAGGIYVDKLASELIFEIMSADEGMTFEDWGQYELADELKDIKLTGYIPVCTCREALQQVAFALRATVSDARSGKIRIFRALNCYSSILGRARKFDGGKTAMLSPVSSVTVLEHSYSISADTEEVYRGTIHPGGPYLIYLSDPAANVVSQTSGIGIRDAPDGSPASANAVWVLSQLDADAELVLSGKKYVDSTKPCTATNPDNGGSPVTVEDATLISAGNSSEVAEYLLAYYNLRFQTEVDFPLEEEQAGDKIAVENKSGTGFTLNIAESLEIDAVGGMVATAKLLSDGTDLVMSIYTGDIYCGESLGVV